MRILVAGANGMLGRDVCQAARRAGHEALPHDLPELDIVDGEAVRELLRREAPRAIVNCAAWTDVDGAESHVQEAYAANAAGAGNLARGAAELEMALVHVSTDYVFDGQPPRDATGAERAYLERDPTGPRSVYGASKLAGELEVLAASARHTVARTAWLFGVGGKNFVDTMLALAGERPEVSVVDDQIGCPTWTGHLAPALVGLLERSVSGLAHLAGAGRVSWHGFAREIFHQAESPCRARAVSSAEFPRPAPRPGWSALESERQDVIPLPPWQDGLAAYLAARDGMIRP
ncbi:MAG TPA: dTDP-4-dehydrorhamnose reductase [Solirubrobacteraceae bacterium]|nr:dTDP-4-dehydrorhamnose reductase [Solirubrobacteraceae bacterium]